MDASKACARIFRNWGGAAVPLSMGELSPHLTQCGGGRGLYLHAKFHLDLSNRLAAMHPR